MSRIVRSVPMRPVRPLGFGPRERAKRTKRDQRLRRPPRITIDMLKHGSVHLQGIFVDVGLSRVPAPSTSFGRHVTVDGAVFTGIAQHEHAA